MRAVEPQITEGRQVICIDGPAFVKITVKSAARLLPVNGEGCKIDKVDDVIAVKIRPQIGVVKNINCISNRNHRKNDSDK